MNPLLTQISERDFQAQVLELARLEGWRAYHTWSAKHSAPGYPDLTLLRGPDLLYLELKTERGRLRPEQIEWILALNQVRNVAARLVRPSDWHEIVRVLGRPA